MLRRSGGAVALTTALLLGCASGGHPPSAADANAAARAEPATPAQPGTATTGELSAPARAAPPPAAIDLQGQLSIKLLALGDQPAKGASLGFFFHGHPDAGRLELMTPLGSQIAQVGWTRAGAWLQRAGGRSGDPAREPRLGADLSANAPEDGLERFDSIDAMSERVLGEAIPLQTLIHWMQGRADPDRPSVTAPNADLAIGTFSQDGWLIDTREWPRLLQATRAAGPMLRGIQIKVRLDR